jgi:hypothetical protein
MRSEWKVIPELERLVRERTHHRVKDLEVDVRDERIILQGVVSSFHLKQLAQHGILDVMPSAKLVNEIVVR